ncbi:hypothetical protein CWI39_3120p0010, partial [Hamiltosporidium magnivora]
PVNTTTNTYHPLNTTTNKQNPLNTTTTNTNKKRGVIYDTTDYDSTNTISISKNRIKRLKKRIIRNKKNKNRSKYINRDSSKYISRDSSMYNNNEVYNTTNTNTNTNTNTHNNTANTSTLAVINTDPLKLLIGCTNNRYWINRKCVMGVIRINIIDYSKLKGFNYISINSLSNSSSVSKCIEVLFKNMYILVKGVNDKDVLEGDSNSDEQQGVMDKDMLEGVSNSSNKQQGVSNKDSNYKGVSNSTDNQQGVSNSSSNYKAVNTSTNKQHPSTSTSTSTTTTTLNNNVCNDCNNNIYKTEYFITKESDLSTNIKTCYKCNNIILNNCIPYSDRIPMCRCYSSDKGIEYNTVYDIIGYNSMLGGDSNSNSSRDSKCVSKGNNPFTTNCNTNNTTNHTTNNNTNHTTNNDTNNTTTNHTTNNNNNTYDYSGVSLKVRGHRTVKGYSLINIGITLPISNTSDIKGINIEEGISNCVSK